MRFSPLLQLAVTSILMFVVESGASQIIINEFMAANSTAVNDPDNDESADWIELYNTSNIPIDLTGYYLTDNLSDETKWAIPEGTIISSNGFLIFWADGTNLGLHTSFKLSSIGEELGLYDPDLNLVDGFVYELQKTDVSYGRETDAGAGWGWFTEPTPNASNNSSFPYEGITYYEPSFSTKGGFYTTGQQLELTSLEGEIHFTLDGRTPTESDSIYTVPITFNTSTFIRARVFLDGFIPGPTITHSYFFDDSVEDRGLPVVSLVTDPDFFWDSEIGLYVQDFKPDWEHPVNIEFFENDGNNRSVFNERAGVKINGQNSWVLPQKMLGIYFRGRYGAGKLDYPLFHDRDRASYDDFILRAGGSDWALTLIRDALSQSLTQENAPVAHQGFRQSILFLNGEYMGIHNLRSRTNDGFIEENFGQEPGSYDLIANDGDVEEGSDAQYLLMDSLFNNDLSIQSNFDSLSNIVDIENYTDYWITEIWSSNSSWGHNVLLWKPKEGGKWQFIFGDLDRGFSGSSNDDLDEFSNPTGSSSYNYGRRWLEHMFQNDTYAAYFAQRFNDHIYTTFHPVRVDGVIDDFVRPILPEITHHVDRWSGTTSNYGNGISSVDFWEDQIVGLHEFANQRQGFIMSDIQSTFNLGNIANLGASSFPADGGGIKINEFKIPELPWSGPYFEEMPLALTAVPNPGFEFIGWSVNEFLDLISLEENWKYHDLGENLGTAWYEISYADSTWSEGAAELGYGDGDEATELSYGSDGNNKHITTYFRKSFEFAGSEEALSCLLKVRRDDGAIIYLNGEEIVRSNMPSDSITFETTSSDFISGADESNLLEYLLELTLLTGTNVLAVEIHQFNNTSSDISFDLSLSVQIPSSDIISTEEVLPITLMGNASYSANYESTGECLLPSQITANTTLGIDCSPYLTNGDVTVLPDVSLTIDPGVEIWFTENARLIIQGDLQVNGTESQGVLFRENETYGAEAWGNLTFDKATGISHLNYLVVRNATKGLHPVHHRAAITGWFSEVVMDHMTLTTNFSNPIYAEYGDISLKNSLIHSDVTGDLINVKYGNGYISDCIFIGNEEPDTDAIDYDEVSDGVIRNSSIEGFLGFNSDGIDLGEESQNILIENCFINDCTDKGISIGQKSSALIQNNTIVNCNIGVGLKDLGFAVIDHLSFYSNVTAISAFQKNPGSGGGRVSVSNSILSNSSITPMSIDEHSTGIAESNFYDTGNILGLNNSWMNPLFVAPSNYNFQLQPGSPALSAGIGGEDLGTSDFSYESEPKIMLSDIEYFDPSNPGIEFVKILNSGTEVQDISNYNFSKGILFTFPEGTIIAPGEKITLVKDMSLLPDLTGQVFEWTTGQLANEGELLLLRDSHGIVIDHVRYSPSLPWPSSTISDEYITIRSPLLDNHFASSWVSEGATVGSEEVEQDKIQVFPNPVNEQLFLSYSRPVYSLKIFDSVGRLVMERTPNSNRLELDIVGLKSGVFTVLINGECSARVIKI
jgi:hypothetical protein